jgi:hypothetical protein
MELPREDNIDTAADPQAIQFAPPQKRPISDNDPTRDISTRQAGQRLFVVALIALALLAMAVLTVLVFTGR